MFKLPRVFVENKTGVDLALDKVSGLGVCWVEADASNLSSMKTGDILLRVYESPLELTADTFYRGGELCPNIYFALLLDELVQLPEDFEIKSNLLYVGGKECGRQMIVNWFRFIINDYQSKTNAGILQTLIDSAPDMIWFKDLAEYHVGLNKAFCKVVGKKREDCINQQHPEIWDTSREDYKKDDFVCRKTEQEVIEAGHTLPFEEVVDKGDEVIHLDTYKTPLRDCYGALIGTCGIGRDKTEEHKMSRRLETVLGAVPFPLFVCDTDYGITDMNSSASALVSGYGSAFSNYKVWKDLFLHKDGGAKHTNDAIYIYNEGLNTRYFSVYEEEIIGAEERHIGYVCILIDVTYERICNDLLDKAAYYDYLTDTKNRRCFYEELASYRGKEISLVYLDLDHFKEINDSCGHDMGDEVLRRCLGILKKVFGKEKVYRIGGDEFTIIVEGSNEESVRRGLEVVKDNIRAMAPENIPLDVSFGISHTTDLQDIDAFIKVSDKMMYKAKGSR